MFLLIFLGRILYSESLGGVVSLSSCLVLYCQRASVLDTLKAHMLYEIFFFQLSCLAFRLVHLAKTHGEELAGGACN